MNEKEYGWSILEEFEDIKKNRQIYLSSLNYLYNLVKNIGRFGI